MDKRRDMGIYTFSCQLLLNPRADDTEGFMRNWLRHYKSAPIEGKTINYVLVDAARSYRQFLCTAG
jgi:hypothetical protein